MDVARHESADLRWEMASRDAHRRLLGYVRNYTGYFGGTTPGDYLARRLPDGGGVTINSVQDEGTRRS